MWLLLWALKSHRFIFRVALLVFYFRDKFSLYSLSPDRLELAVLDRTGFKFVVILMSLLPAAGIRGILQRNDPAWLL